MERVETSNNVEITSLVGREVYTANGVFIGEVSDLKIDFHGQEVSRLVLEYVNEDVVEVPRRKQGILVPYRWVQSVGDIVVVTDFIEGLDYDRRE